MAVDCKECRKTCFKPDMKSFIKGETFIFSILLIIVSMGMSMIRISKYDPSIPGIFHKLPYDITTQPDGLLGIFKHCFNKTNVEMGNLIRNLSTTKEGKSRNKIFSVFIGIVGVLSIIGVVLYQLFTVVNLFMGRVKGTQPKIPSYWPLYILFGPIFLIIAFSYIGYLVSIISYLLSTPEFFFATIIVVSSIMVYLHLPQYPYMSMGLSGGGLVGALLLGGK